MNKKKYMKPAIEVGNEEVSQMLCTSEVETLDISNDYEIIDVEDQW